LACARGLIIHLYFSNPAVRDFELTAQLLLFPVFLMGLWVTALLPFIVVRQCGRFIALKCGGFANLWQEMGGGIATAILAFPIAVWWARYLDVEGGPPYFPALAAVSAMPILWLAVVVCGAIGGLAYWFFTSRRSSLPGASGGAQG
jgi:hypothetical protein